MMIISVEICGIFLGGGFSIFFPNFRWHSSALEKKTYNISEAAFLENRSTCRGVRVSMARLQKNRSTK